jgi:class 3 adenylate cyclase
MSNRAEIDAFLREWPWPKELAAQGVPLEYLWSFDVPVSAEEIWPHLVETSRFNRAMGLSPMEFEESDGTLRGSAVNGFTLQEWVETPWSWVWGKHLDSMRVYSRGFAKLVRAILTVTPKDDGSGVVLHVYFGWIPRTWFGSLMLRIGMPMIEKGYRKVLPDVIAHARAAATTTTPLLEQAAPPLGEEARARLAAIVKALESDPIAQGVVLQLAEHVAKGDEKDLYRLRPLALARRWSASESDVLAVCLHATRAGMLELSWDVICPHCRGTRDQVKSLGDVPGVSSCGPCGIDFKTDAENAIEITFNVHPSIRTVPRLFYCAAEPSTKLHIKLAQRVAASSKREVELALPRGTYRLRVGSDRRGAIVRVDDEVAEGQGTRVAWTPSFTGEIKSARSPLVLELDNPTDTQQTFTVEDTRWAADALQPARLFTFQSFLDLFSKEYIAADIQLAVGQQTIVFTDMVGSTVFYSTHGDPDAFMEVKRHFAEIYEEVRRHDGAVVKTIGDAAMAAFAHPLDGLRAAAAIQKRFHGGRTDTSIRLHASLHVGPCIAVNLNSGIDYFGNTVNVAAKLQALSDAGQVALSKAVLDAAGVSEWIRDQGITLEHVTLEHAAFDKPLDAYRWTVKEE